ncbi:MAG: hypothetical protein KGH57_03235 [Candidatus Micrarchaeota archaeon]|nr:hypothetical protein [Candidatus Micrarchaeota archaeon]
MVKTLYACSVCGYIYEKKEDAEKCEAYCRKHNACSLAITSLAVGNISK